MADTHGEGFVLRESPEAGRSLSFIDFLVGLGSTAMIHMGAPNPETGASETNLTLARESLDLLGMLREKTEGNLTDEEARFFDNLLTELRLAYVKATRK